MKKTACILLTGLMAVSLAACGRTGGSAGDLQKSLAESSEQKAALLEETNQNGENMDLQENAGQTDTAGEDKREEPAPDEEKEESVGSDMLVVYFSYGENADLPEGVDASSSASIQAWDGGITGNTGLVAHMISDAAGADLFSVQTVEKYPDSYDATIDQGKEEQSADARPELATHVENMDGYDTIFFGFPNWWGDMPMAMYTFLEEYDLSGKTIIPFVTSGGSGFSGTVQTIENLQEAATVREGISISGSSAADARSQIEEWLRGLGIDVVSE